MKNLARHEKIFHALSHPTRLLFVERLAGGEKRRKELEYGVPGEYSKIHEHLMILENSGAIKARKMAHHFIYTHGGAALTKAIEAAKSILGPSPSRERQAQLFAALAYPKRLGIIETLAQEPVESKNLKALHAKLETNADNYSRLFENNLISMRDTESKSLQASLHPKVVELIEAVEELAKSSKQESVNKKLGRKKK